MDGLADEGGDQFGGDGVGVGFCLVAHGGDQFEGVVSGLVDPAVRAGDQCDRVAEHCRGQGHHQGADGHLVDAAGDLAAHDEDGAGQGGDGEERRRQAEAADHVE